MVGRCEPLGWLSSESREDQCQGRVVCSLEVSVVQSSEKESLLAQRELEVYQKEKGRFNKLVSCFKEM